MNSLPGSPFDYDYWTIALAAIGGFAVIFVTLSLPPGVEIRDYFLERALLSRDADSASEQTIRLRMNLTMYGLFPFLGACVAVALYVGICTAAGITP